jgi:hypothetical protein
MPPVKSINHSLGDGLPRATKTTFPTVTSRINSIRELNPVAIDGGPAGI